MTYPVTTGDLMSAADWNALPHAIESISLGTGTTASFSNPVPTGFRHLMVMANGALDGDGVVGVRFNDEAGTAYESLGRSHANTAANDVEDSSTGTSRILVARWNTTGGTAWARILDYNNAAVTRVEGGGSRSHPTGVANMLRTEASGRWTTTNAVTKVTLASTTTSTNFAGGAATLYGIP